MIKTKTLEQQNIAKVKKLRNWRYLQQIEEQTERICLAAVRNSGNALEFVKEQTPKICLAAVKQNGDALRFVKNKTEEICMAAIKETPYAMQFAPMVFAEEEK